MELVVESAKIAASELVVECAKIRCSTSLRVGTVYYSTHIVVLCSTYGTSSVLYCIQDVVLVLLTSGKEKQQLILEVCTVLAVPGPGAHLATPLFSDFLGPVLVLYWKLRHLISLRAI